MFCVTFKNCKIDINLAMLKFFVSRNKILQNPIFDSHIEVDSVLLFNSILSFNNVTYAKCETILLFV